MNRYKQELKGLSVHDLQHKVSELRYELLGARLAKISGQLKDVSRIRTLKKQIAQALTHLQLQKEDKA